MTTPRDADTVLAAIFSELEGYFAEGAEQEEVEAVDQPAPVMASMHAAPGRPGTTAPWVGASGPDTKLLFPIPAEMNAKMQWVMDNVPKMKSKQLIVREAVMAYLDAQIATHYKA